MAENLEEKIKNIRELGQQESKGKKIKAPKFSFSDPMKRRALVGALTIILLISIVGAFVYHKQKENYIAQLEQEKALKIQEINNYFKGPLENSTYKQELISQVQSAQKIEEVRAIDVKSAYQKALEEYNKQIEEQERLKYLKELEDKKTLKLQELDTKFAEFLSLPLPEDIKAKAIEEKTTLRAQIENATKIEDVEAVNIDIPLLTLWREYATYKVQSLPGNYVVLSYDGQEYLMSKEKAIFTIQTLNSIDVLKTVYAEEVHLVTIALSVKRTNIVGGFVQPGDLVKIFGINPTSGEYEEVVEQGEVQLVLIPTDGAKINAFENYVTTISGSESTSTSTTNTDSESKTFVYNGVTYETSETSSDTTSESSTDQYSSSESQSYGYSTALTELIKMLTVGKVENKEEVEAALQEYGLRLLNYEKDSNIKVIPDDAVFLVVVKVPDKSVADLLNHKDWFFVKIEGVTNQ